VPLWGEILPPGIIPVAKFRAHGALLGHYCHIFTFVVGLEQCKNMGRQPNYEPFIVPVAAIPVTEGDLVVSGFGHRLK
jgi:hypothetical protein